MQQTPILRFEQVSKRFGATVAVDDVSLDIAHGERQRSALVAERGYAIREHAFLDVAHLAHEHGPQIRFLLGRPRPGSRFEHHVGDDIVHEIARLLQCYTRFRQFERAVAKARKRGDVGGARAHIDHNHVRA